jgi:hypothetical protein
MEFCRSALATIENRRVKGWGWAREYLSWHADLAADIRRLRELGEL